MNAVNSTTRFSDRVDRYIKYRPGYPDEIYAYLQTEAGLKPGAEIADLGSGTGLLSKLFLANRHTVYGIEPNADMRAAGEKFLKGEEKFISLNGQAEKIPLSKQSVDFVIAGQAFHWFDPHKSKIEVKRILRPGGQVALIWNSWEGKLSPFLEGYEELLINFGTDYNKVNRNTNSENSILDFFGSSQTRYAEFSNVQHFDFDGLQGRLLSSSYAPLEDHPNYRAMIDKLLSLYEHHVQDGKVRFDYRTTVYHAEMGE